jgi:hypothetical protein
VIFDLLNDNDLAPIDSRGVFHWLSVPEGTALSLGDANRSIVWKDLTGTYRPDVAGAYLFRVTSEPREATSQLHVRLRNGSFHQMSLDLL